MAKNRRVSLSVVWVHPNLAAQPHFAYMHKCNVLCERPNYKIGGFPPGVGCKVLGNMVSYTLNPSMKADTPGGKVADAGILGTQGFYRDNGN